jgi:hypothetical protein
VIKVIDLLFGLGAIFFVFLIFCLIFHKPDDKFTKWSKSPHKLYYNGNETSSLKPEKSRYQKYLEETVNMQEHQEKFFCHICHEPSQGPQRYKNKVYWNEPTGLVECRKCKQLTCLNCLKYGLCKNCRKPVKNKTTTKA